MKGINSIFNVNGSNGNKEKRILTYFLVLVFITFLGSQIADYLIEKQTPEFLKQLIDKSTNDTALMSKIGGYKSLGSRHTRVSADTILVSQFIIHGNESELIRTVRAVKRNENWEVKSLINSIK